jgi:hypothetical protein
MTCLHMGGIKVPIATQPQKFLDQFRVFILIKARFGHKAESIPKPNPSLSPHITAKVLPKRALA